MAERKAISKKVRFEVFKRDSFKCQYCGKSAPDVILHVDHIKPVKEGGSNHITNLVTSCFDCNMGKKDRLLDDQSMLEKQKQQLQELNERRQQLEMMMEWREGLMALEQDQISYAVKKWQDSTKNQYVITENGSKKLQRAIKKYGLNEVLDAIDTAANQYLKFVDGKCTQESVDEGFSKIVKILAFNESAKKKPYLKDLYYLRGIINNRLNYMNPHIAINLLEKVYLAGASLESMTGFCKTVRTWSDFRYEMERFIEARKSKEGEEDES